MPIFLQLNFRQKQRMTVWLSSGRKICFQKNLHNFCKVIVKNTCIIWIDSWHGYFDLFLNCEYC